MNVLHQTSGENWELFHGDTVDVARGLPSRSVDMSVFSPPFASLYTYSASARDMGNVKNDTEFFAHYDYLIKETRRVMRGGRIVAIHCMDMPTSKERDGHIGIRDFPGAIIRAYERHGFIFHSRVAIWKDPVTAMQRTKALGLLHKTVRKDSAMSRQGLLDFLVVMRTPGANEIPIAHTSEGFPVERWQRYASPVWVTLGGVDDEGFVTCDGTTVPGDDSSTINPSDTLQYRSAREADDERHICPLQLPVIRRAVRLWSNLGDVVWSPFAGIGSEGYVALQEGRRFVGAELKASYYAQAAANLKSAMGTQSSLFAQ